MLKKDLGLLVLILVVGAVVGVINPRFLSPINLANTANLIGLFGLFSIGAGLRHHHRRHRAVGRLDVRAARRVFVDLIANYGVPWPLAAADRRAASAWCWARSTAC